MSFTGRNPSYKWLTFEPQSADPTSPNEGDVFRSNGTPRDEGLWIYEGGAWVQIATGASLSTVASLTLTPQSSDPGSPVEGMVFRADGTSRAEGLWEYQNGDWVQLSGLRYQEFYHKDVFEVRIATTTNAALSSGNYQAGGTLDGVVLVANDLILLKNQTTASENGVYTVNTGVAPTRHASYDSASELNNAVIYAEEGTTNKHTFWYQTATLTSLSDSQTWASSPANKSFVVPEGVYQTKVTLAGAGGGGGGGGSNTTATSSLSSSGGAGGQGSVPVEVELTVTPGETITVIPGTHGKKGAGAANPNTTAQARGTGASGATGGATTISGSFGTITVPGGVGGSGGQSNGNPGGVGVASTISSYLPAYLSGGGSGGLADIDNGVSGSLSIYASGGAGGAVGTGSRDAGGGGGGGGAGLKAGMAGGDGVDTNLSEGIDWQTPSVGNATNQSLRFGAGGGGGGGGQDTNPQSVGGKIRGAGGHGSHGGSGYVKFSWS